jgi:hypothetical protein
MKLILFPILVAMLSCSGCVSWVVGAARAAGRTAPGQGDSSSSGIDPVTMAGIEASNRATEEAAQNAANAASAAAAQAGIQAGIDASNAAAAAAAAAAANQ